MMKSLVSTGRLSSATESERCAGPGHRFPLDCSDLTASEGRRTSSLLLAPPCPPPENPCPFAGLSRGRPPPNALHREVAVLIGGYSAQPLSQPRPFWVAVRLLG